VITYAGGTASHMVPELVTLTGVDGHGIESVSTGEIATTAPTASAGKRASRARLDRA
jgi:hypothetical protein